MFSGVESLGIDSAGIDVIFVGAVRIGIEKGILLLEVEILLQ